MLQLNPTVFVVDPDPSVRASAELVIRRAGWSARVCATGAEFLSLPRHPGPHCVVLALDLPGDDAAQLVSRLSVERREASVIVVSPLHNVPGTVQIMKAGASEVLMQPVPDETLLAAIGSGLGRSHEICRKDAYLLELSGRYETLSRREREVMARVVSGLLNKQVAGSLGICEITVKVHRRRAMRKMGAESFAQLVGMAILLSPGATEQTYPLRLPHRATSHASAETLPLCR